MIGRFESGNHVDGVHGLADLLEPDSSRAAAAADIAFADTVHVRELEDDAPPPSGPVIVNDPDQGTQWMTPFAFPLPPASADVSVATRLRVLSARIRHGLRGAFEELRELWTATTEVVGERGDGRALTLARRVQALWSFWQWERADLLRAAAIGLAVFALAATIGAVALESSEEAASAASASGTAVVRKTRTVDEHTGRIFAARVKAAR